MNSIQKDIVLRPYFLTTLRTFRAKKKQREGILFKKKEYLHKNFKRMASFFSLLFLGFLSFPSLAFSAPSFEISECSGSSCTILNNNEVIVPSEGNQSVTIRIGIKNPDNTSLYSVQSWFQYNPQIWEVISLSDENSDFELAAPGEFKAKSDTGEIRIGRAVSGVPITAEHSIVADIVLKSKKDPTFSTLSWKDFMEKDVGKTSIIGLSGTTPVNLLSSRPKDIKFSPFKTSSSQNKTSNSAYSSSYSTLSSPSSSSQLKGNSGSSTVKNTAVQNQGKTETQLQNPSLEFVDIERPIGLRSRTHENGGVDHLWKMGTDKRISGYYLYYSTSSGVYMHRKDVGKTNAVSFPSGFFEKGKRVYFAVQAYSSDKKVSDFSDETYLVVGTVGSESHPFFDQIFPNAVKIGEENGDSYFSTNNNGADLTSQSKPNLNVKTGIDIPSEMFLIFGGVALFFSRKLIQYS